MPRLLAERISDLEKTKKLGDFYKEISRCNRNQPCSEASKLEHVALHNDSSKAWRGLSLKKHDAKEKMGQGTIHNALDNAV